MDYVKGKKGAVYCDGRFRVYRVAHLWKVIGYAIFKRQTMEGNSYIPIKNEVYESEDEAIARIKQMIESEQ